MSDLAYFEPLWDGLSIFCQERKTMKYSAVILHEPAGKRGVSNSWSTVAAGGCPQWLFINEEGWEWWALQLLEGCVYSLARGSVWSFCLPHRLESTWISLCVPPRRCMCGFNSCPFGVTLICAPQCFLAQRCKEKVEELQPQLSFYSLLHWSSSDNFQLFSWVSSSFVKHPEYFWFS